MSSSLTNLLSWQDLSQLSQVSPLHKKIFSHLLECFEKKLLQEQGKLDLISPADVRQGLVNGAISETWSRGGCETTYAIPGSECDLVFFDPAPLHG